MISSVTIDSTLKVLTLGSSFKLHNWTENIVQIKVFIREKFIHLIEIKPGQQGYIPVDLAIGEITLKYKGYENESKKIFLNKLKKVDNGVSY